MKVGEFAKLLAALPADAEMSFTGNYPLGNLDISSVHVHLDPPHFIVVMKRREDGSWQADEDWDMDEQVIPAPVPAPTRGQFAEMWNPSTDPTYQGWDAYWKGSRLEDSPFVSSKDTKAWKNGWMGAADWHMDEVEYSSIYG